MLKCLMDLAVGRLGHRAGPVLVCSEKGTRSGVPEASYSSWEATRRFGTKETLCPRIWKMRVLSFVYLIGKPVLKVLHQKP